MIKGCQIKKEFVTNNVTETKRLGKKLAEEILKSKLSKKAFVIGLEGDLGGGKTTFLQGFARGLKIKEKILSPTFVIIKRFTLSHSKFLNFYHIDCYRIEKPKELLKLGFKKIISEPSNIVAIEWSEKAKRILPKKTTILKFEFLNKSKRKITKK
jgi:tRNA threonylcarbamoyladenosine biosynthesis protein TsaE